MTLHAFPRSCPLRNEVRPLDFHRRPYNRPSMNSFSQFGEDVLVWEHFGRKRDGFFIEVGANAPFTYSQTWLLEQQGWTGVLVEPLAGRGEELRRNRPGSRVFQVAVGAPENRGTITLQVPEDDMFASLKPSAKGPAAQRTESVRLATLDDLIAEAGVRRLDYLSIDVEGMELEVLRGFDLARHRPALILVEDHLKSLAVYRHLSGRSYRLVKRTGAPDSRAGAGAGAVAVAVRGTGDDM